MRTLETRTGRWLASVVVLFAASTPACLAPGDAPEPGGDLLGEAQQADRFASPAPGNPLVDGHCVDVADHALHGSGWPYHEPGPCPTTDAYTVADAKLSCGEKVKYFGYYCSDLTDGTHTWTAYFGCCASTCAGPVLTFASRYYPPQPTPGLMTPPPASPAQAIALFNSLPTGVPGYGQATLSSTAGFSNQTSIAGGNGHDVGSHLTASFRVPAAQAGPWSFRLGADYGYGGVLVVDWGQSGAATLDEHWDTTNTVADDFYWGQDWASPHVLSGSINLGGGVHVIEAYGFEDGLGANMRLEFLAPGATSWQPLSAQTLPLCGG